MTMEAIPSASFGLTFRVRIVNRPGTLGGLTTAIGRAGGDIGAIEIVGADRDFVTRDMTVNASSARHADAIVHAVRETPGIDVIDVVDRTFELHSGGKIEVVSKTPLRNRSDLAMAYTPGVARVCQAIEQDPEKIYSLTIKRNTVAIVSDGTAVLGLGNIGPAAALPVMEGKAMLFKEFAGIDAFPICLTTTDPTEIVETVTRISTAFGGINLEDISAPRCFDIEDRLKEALDIPVFHDDQHGTAVVVLAALINALAIVGKTMPDLKVVVSGVGAAGVACTRILLAAGVRNIVGCDQRGVIYRGRRERMTPQKHWYAEHTNPQNEPGTVQTAIKGADVFLGLSAPGVISARDVKTMARDAIVFAMANPTPEIMPEQVKGDVAIMATGRSDYPNQINNVLCFPGIFLGALRCRAVTINEAMKLAAAHAIAEAVPADQLRPDHIVPSVFDRRVVEEVSRAVEAAAIRTDVVRVGSVGRTQGDKRCLET